MTTSRMLLTDCVICRMGAGASLRQGKQHEFELMCKSLIRSMQNLSIKKNCVQHGQQWRSRDLVFSPICRFQLCLASLSHNSNHAIITLLHTWWIWQVGGVMCRGFGRICGHTHADTQMLRHTHVHTHTILPAVSSHSTHFCVYVWACFYILVRTIRIWTSDSFDLMGNSCLESFVLYERNKLQLCLKK